MLYEGWWYGQVNDRDEPHGIGRYIMSATGSVYEGQQSHGKLYGWGRMIWFNGDVFEGTWKNNCMHGFGVETKKGKKPVEGKWGDDIFLGRTTPEKGFFSFLKF